MSRWTFLLLAAFLLGAFQNCSDVKFASMDSSLQKSGDGTPLLDDEDPVIVSDDDEEKDEDVNADGPESLQDGCLKFQDLSVGQVIEIGAESIVISDLIYKTDSGEGGELIGFELASTAEVSFLVKAGGEGYGGIGDSFINPNGLEGPEASAISHVTFCIGVDPEQIYDPSLPSSEELLAEEDEDLLEGDA